MEGSLICNHKRCQTALTSTAWVTSCSHIFCDEHSPACESEKKCPVCSSDLSGRYDLLKNNLNPSEDYKSMVLAGLSPTNILEIGSKAMAFWKFQIFLDKIYLTSTLRYLRGRLAQTESSYETMSERLKSLIQQETLKCEHMKKELSNYIKKTQDLEEKIGYKNRQMFNLKMRYEALQKQQNTQSPFEQNKHNENLRQRASSSQISPNFMSQMQNLDVGRVFSSQHLPTTSRPIFNFQPQINQQVARGNERLPKYP